MACKKTETKKTPVKKPPVKTDSAKKTAAPKTIKAKAVSSLPLNDLSFCFTGELKSMKSKQAEEKVKTLGASVRSGVTKGLRYLVTNNPDSGSNKNKKAVDLGVKVINEKQFPALLGKKSDLVK